jgi:hypothetical protein
VNAPYCGDNGGPPTWKKRPNTLDSVPVPYRWGSVSAGNSLPRATFTSEFPIVGPHSLSPTCSFCGIDIVIVIGCWGLGGRVDHEA